MQGQLISPGNRPVRSLRISVTDRCNLRGPYGTPAADGPFLPAASLLSVAEIARVVRIAAGMGVTKVRLTGGEPLLRRDIVDLVREVGRLPGIADVSLVTNGSRLEQFALPLRAAGLKRVEVALDTLDATQFREMTGGGSLARILAGLTAAEAVGLTPVKVTAVIIRGFNENQILPLMDLGARRGWQVHFVEAMPENPGQAAADKPVVPAAEILAKVQERFALQEMPRSPGAPVKLYRLPGSEATVGFITAANQHFCDSCNRMRLTADGKIRSCLLVRGEADLREHMRAGCSDSKLAELLLEAAALKPEWHGVTPAITAGATAANREIGE